MASGVASAEPSRIVHFNLIADTIVPVAARSGSALLDAPDANGVRPVWRALTSDTPHVLHVLVKHGATVDFVDSATGMTPLMRASDENRETDLISFLSERTERHINAQDTKDGRTALWIAASRHNLDAVRLILGRSANVDLTDSGSLSPLMVATRDTDPRIAAALIDAGAALNGFPSGQPLISYLLESEASDAMTTNYIRAATKAGVSGSVLILLTWPHKSILIHPIHRMR
jgi:ankyrin repeat protein